MEGCSLTRRPGGEVTPVRNLALQERKGHWEMNGGGGDANLWHQRILREQGLGLQLIGLASRADDPGSLRPVCTQTAPDSALGVGLLKFFIIFPRRNRIFSFYIGAHKLLSALSPENPTAEAEPDSLLAHTTHIFVCTPNMCVLIIHAYTPQYKHALSVFSL